MITLCFYNNEGETCNAPLQPTHANFGCFLQDLETSAVKKHQSLHVATKGECDIPSKLSANRGLISKTPTRKAAVPTTGKRPTTMWLDLAAHVGSILMNVNTFVDIS